MGPSRSTSLKRIFRVMKRILNCVEIIVGSNSTCEAIYLCKRFCKKIILGESERV